MSGVEQGDRERSPGGGRKRNLRTVSEKLFFILLYFKCYPTYPEIDANPGDSAI